MSSSFLCLLLASVVAVYSQGAPDGGSTMIPEFNELGMARVIVQKQMLSQYAVEDKEFVIQYNIYNVGDKPATRLQLDDRHSFASQYFEVVSGSLHAKWSRLAAGANLTHSVVLKPLETGAFNVTTAIVQYLPNEGEDTRYATSTAPGEIYIYKLKDYERKFSPHYLDWAVFVLMAAPCIVLPGLLWYKTYKKYDGKKVKKN